ncbi:MAG TPA: hypothetical protein DHW82_12230 [Spirochaetia bacterium]|nr:hypothetical protein [Spirochaetia bacterium]
MEGKNPKKHHSIKMILFGAVFILIAAQTVNLILAVSSFEHTYRSSLISKYQVLGGELKKQIETSVNFGKPIYKFAGMENLFEIFKQKDSNITHFTVTQPDNLTLYSTDQTQIKKKISFQKDTILFKPVLKQGEEEEPIQIIEEEEHYFIAFPIYQNHMKVVGHLVLQFSKTVINKEVNGMIKDNLFYFSIILLSAFFILFALLLFIRSKNKDSFTFFRFKKNFTLKFVQNTAVILVLMISQFSYTFLNMNYFKEKYVEIIDKNLNDFSGIIKENLEKYTKLGLKIERLKKAEFLLYEKLKIVPECQEIRVTDLNYKILYYADQNKKLGTVFDKNFDEIFQEKNTQGLIKKTIVDSQGVSVKGYLFLTQNKNLIQSKIREIFLDALTVIIISLVFSFQLLALFSLFMNKTAGKEREEEETETESMNIIRFTSFIFFFGESLPLSFLPIYIQKVYAENPVSFFGFSEETLMSIPISAYMFGVSIFVLLAGHLSKKMSSRNIFFISVPLLFFGSLLSGLSTNVFMLTVARFITGMGYGATIINGISLIVEKTTHSNRTAGFGYWSAGYAAAFICATAIGGVIAERLGFRAGMFVSMFFSFCFGLFVFFFVKSPKIKKALAEKMEKVKLSLKDFLFIFKNKSLLAALLFASVPVQIAFIGIFQYSFPLFMSDMGVTPSNIGRILTIYAVISLLTPYIGKMADKSQNERKYIIIGNLITGLGLIVFLFTQEVTALIFVIMAIGVGGMFVDATEESYITSSEEAESMGEAKLLSIYTTYEKIVAIMVPLIAGMMINALGYSKSIVFMGFFILIGVGMFALLSRNMRKMKTSKVKENE